uniref:Uncharacterized protein n=1 Tax=Physcomitrium patens TaxID=3218 RepID=A0A2K1IV11_PHYPA|nr:hypothetical protein PHYPA_025057 [Physcomitrium patens]
MQAYEQSSVLGQPQWHRDGIDEEVRA